MENEEIEEMEGIEGMERVERMEGTETCSVNMYGVCIVIWCSH